MQTYLIWYLLAMACFYAMAFTFKQEGRRSLWLVFLETILLVTFFPFVIISMGWEAIKVIARARKK